MSQVIDWHEMGENAPATCPLVIVALGSNLPGPAGAPAQTLSAALKGLGDSGLAVASVSRFFATPCFPKGAGPDYVNAVAILTGASDPARILSVLHRIEAAHGRERDQRWGQRTLDLDLVAVGDAVSPDRATFETWRDLPLTQQMRRAPDQLILPHPRLQDRAFVLVPLAEIAPGWMHPVTGQTVQQMCDALPQAEKSVLHPL